MKKLLLAIALTLAVVFAVGCLPDSAYAGNKHVASLTINGVADQSDIPATKPVLVLPATVHEVGFSSKGDVTAKPLAIKFIDAAQGTLVMAAYQLTEPDIIRALVRAKQRGVDVRVVLDKSLTQKEAPGIMKEAGIGCKIQRQYQIMHHKFMVADSFHIENGSFNYTRNATLNNAENALAIWNAPSDLVSQYEMQWTALWNGGVDC
jgi:phosphatidylserine/phosphatidylglycerophosphate/cardiolipin synthase-like enzyme